MLTHSETYQNWQFTAPAQISSRKLVIHNYLPQVLFQGLWRPLVQCVSHLHFIWKIDRVITLLFKATAEQKIFAAESSGNTAIKHIYNTDNQSTILFLKITSLCAYDDIWESRGTAPRLFNLSTRERRRVSHHTDKATVPVWTLGQEQNLLPLPQIELQFLAHPTHTPVTILTNTTYIFSEIFTTQPTTNLYYVHSFGIVNKL